MKKIDSKLNAPIKSNYGTGRKKTLSEKSVDGFQKGPSPEKLDADVMKDLQKTIATGAGEVSRLERPMTQGEKSRFKMYFPKLDVEKAVVSGEATPVYNCISWTAGVTDEWCWPPSMYPGVSEKEAFDKFYASYGFKPAPEGGEVARWRNTDGLTHGSVSGPGHGPRWESKCGQDLKIQHDKNELESDVYGWIDSYYTKTEEASPVRDKMKISDNVKAEIKSRADRVSSKVKNKFNKLYSEWQTFRKDPVVQFSSNPKDYCKTGAFDEITKMGISAIPLLMEKMSGGDFFCLQALDVIVKNNSEKVGDKISLKPEEVSNSEQNKSILIMDKWING
ncbi:hypothetical protein C4588_01305 [Candidatus Parcubacteria bacterium]|nr:MAG: hypothetical protein C4588_01305 [Candidatus Parcubacteria bacterium]